MITDYEFINTIKTAIKVKKMLDRDKDRNRRLWGKKRYRLCKNTNRNRMIIKARNLLDEKAGKNNE